MRSAVIASTVRISFSDSGRRVDRSASRKRLSYRRPARSLASVPLKRQSPLISENCIVKCFTIEHGWQFVKWRVRVDSRAAQPLPMLRDDRRGAQQEISDQFQVLSRIAAQDLAARLAQLGKNWLHLRVLCLAARDHHSATVDGIVHAADPMAALESIEDSRDRAGGQPNSLRKLPSRHGPQPAD